MPTQDSYQYEDNMLKSRANLLDEELSAGAQKALIRRMLDRVDTSDAALAPTLNRIEAKLDQLLSIFGEPNKSSMIITGPEVKRILHGMEESKAEQAVRRARARGAR